MADNQIDILITAVNKTKPVIDQIKADLASFSQAFLGLKNLVGQITPQLTSVQGNINSLKGSVAQVSAEVKGVKDSFQAVESPIRQLNNNVANFGSSFIGVRNSIGGASNELDTFLRRLNLVATGFLLLKGFDFFSRFAGEAARVESLTTVLHTIASNAGITATQIDKVDKNIQSLGITAAVSKQSLSQFIQAGLKVDDAAKLARASQDLAVISGENSSDTFKGLTQAIEQQSIMMLRWRGIMVTNEEAQDRYAAANGRSVASLSDWEKKQALLEITLLKSARLAGIYEASMGDVGKQASSLERYQTDAAVAIQNSLIPAYSSVVLELTNFLRYVKLIADESNASSTGARSLGASIKSVAESISYSLRTIIEYRGAIFGIVQAYAALKMAQVGVAAYKGVTTAVNTAAAIGSGATTVAAVRAAKLKDQEEKRGIFRPTPIVAAVNTGATGATAGRTIAATGATTAITSEALASARVTEANALAAASEARVTLMLAERAAATARLTAIEANRLAVQARSNAISGTGTAAVAAAYEAEAVAARNAAAAEALRAKALRASSIEAALAANAARTLVAAEMSGTVGRIVSPIGGVITKAFSAIKGAGGLLLSAIGGIPGLVIGAGIGILMWGDNFKKVTSEADGLFTKLKNGWEHVNELVNSHQGNAEGVLKNIANRAENNAEYAEREAGRSKKNTPEYKEYEEAAKSYSDLEAKNTALKYQEGSIKTKLGGSYSSEDQKEAHEIGLKIAESNKELAIAKELLDTKIKAGKITKKDQDLLKSDNDIKAYKDGQIDKKNKEFTDLMNSREAIGEMKNVYGQGAPISMEASRSVKAVSDELLASATNADGLGTAFARVQFAMNNSVESAKTLNDLIFEQKNRAKLAADATKNLLDLQQLIKEGYGTRDTEGKVKAVASDTKYNKDYEPEDFKRREGLKANLLAAQDNARTDTEKQQNVDKLVQREQGKLSARKAVEDPNSFLAAQLKQIQLNDDAALRYYNTLVMASKIPKSETEGKTDQEKIKKAREMAPADYANLMKGSSSTFKNTEQESSLRGLDAAIQEINSKTEQWAKGLERIYSIYDRIRERNQEIAHSSLFKAEAPSSLTVKGDVEATQTKYQQDMARIDEDTRHKLALAHNLEKDVKVDSRANLSAAVKDQDIKKQEDANKINVGEVRPEDRKAYLEGKSGAFPPASITEAGREARDLALGKTVQMPTVISAGEVAIDKKEREAAKVAPDATLSKEEQDRKLLEDSARLAKPELKEGTSTQTFDTDYVAGLQQTYSDNERTIRATEDRKKLDLYKGSHNILKDESNLKHLPEKNQEEFNKFKASLTGLDENAELKDDPDGVKYKSLKTSHELLSQKFPQLNKAVIPLDIQRERSEKQGKSKSFEIEEGIIDQDAKIKSAQEPGSTVGTEAIKQAKKRKQDLVYAQNALAPNERLSQTDIESLKQTKAAIAVEEGKVKAKQVEKTGDSDSIKAKEKGVVEGDISAEKATAERITAIHREEKEAKLKVTKEAFSAMKQELDEYLSVYKSKIEAIKEIYKGVIDLNRKQFEMFSGDIITKEESKVAPDKKVIGTQEAMQTHVKFGSSLDEYSEKRKADEQYYEQKRKMVKDSTADETKKAEELKQIAIDENQAKLKSDKEYFSQLASQRDEAKAKAKKYSDEILALDKEMKASAQDANNSMREVARGGMSDSAKYADKKKELAELQALAKQSAAAGDYDSAKEYGKKAKGVASSLAGDKGASNDATSRKDAIAGITSSEQILQGVMSKQKDIAKSNRDEQLTTVNIITQAMNGLSRTIKQLSEKGEIKLNPKLDEGAIRALQEKIKSVTQTEDTLIKARLEIQDLATTRENIQKELAGPYSATLNVTTNKTGENGQSNPPPPVTAPVSATSAPTTSTTTSSTTTPPLEKADGGMIQGIGTGTSDSIPTLLSRGEFVVKQAAVEHYGSGFLDLLNSKALRFASGGFVSYDPPKFAEGGWVRKLFGSGLLGRGADGLKSRENLVQPTKTDEAVNAKAAREAIESEEAQKKVKEIKFAEGGEAKPRIRGMLGSFLETVGLQSPDPRVVAYREQAKREKAGLTLSSALEKTEVGANAKAKQEASVGALGRRMTAAGLASGGIVGAFLEGVGLQRKGAGKEQAVADIEAKRNAKNIGDKNPNLIEAGINNTTKANDVKGRMVQYGLATGGMVGALLEAVGLQKPDPRLVAYREQAKEKKEGITLKTVMEGTEAGQTAKKNQEASAGALSRRMKEAGLADGGLAKFGGGGKADYTGYDLDAIRGIYIQEAVEATRKGLPPPPVPKELEGNSLWFDPATMRAIVDNSSRKDKELTRDTRQTDKLKLDSYLRVLHTLPKGSKDVPAVPDTLRGNPIALRANTSERDTRFGDTVGKGNEGRSYELDRDSKAALATSQVGNTIRWGDTSTPETRSPNFRGSAATPASRALLADDDPRREGYVERKIAREALEKQPKVSKFKQEDTLSADGTRKVPTFGDKASAYNNTVTKESPSTISDGRPSRRGDYSIISNTTGLGKDYWPFAPGTRDNIPTSYGYKTPMTPNGVVGDILQRFNRKAEGGKIEKPSGFDFDSFIGYMSGAKKKLSPQIDNLYASLGIKDNIPGADHKKIATIGIRAATGGLIPALVSHGEFRVSPDAVNHYGEGLLSSVNEMSFPKFAEGGMFGSGLNALGEAKVTEMFNHLVKLQPSDPSKPPISLKARSAFDVNSMVAALRNQNGANLA